MTPVRAYNLDDYTTETFPPTESGLGGDANNITSQDEFAMASPSSLPSEVDTTHPYFSATQTSTKVSAVLEQVMTTELSVVVNAYPEGCSDYFFAKDVAAVIKKKIQEACSLDYFPTIVGTQRAPYAALLDEYYAAPVRDQAISVVMRRQPHFGELGSVDTQGILTEAQLKKLDKLYNADTRACLAMKKSDAAKALATKQSLDYAWASHAYNNRLVSGPVPPKKISGDLPLELEYTSPGTFDLLHDQEFLDLILSLKKKYNTRPSHAKEILSALGAVISNTMAYWQRVSFDIDQQLFAQSPVTYTPQVANADYIEIHPNTKEDWMAQIPSAAQLAETNFYLSERRGELVTERIKTQAIYKSGASAENQKLFSDFSLIQKDFVSEFGALFPREGLSEMVAESDRWLTVAYQAATFNFSAGVFNGIVTSFFEFVAGLPEGFSRELFCEVGQWLLGAIVSCLESNQIPFATMIEREFGTHEGLHHEVHNMQKAYSDLLWNVQALAALYADGATPHEFSKDIAEDAALTSLRAESPYMRDITATFESLATVLSTATEIIVDRSDYETCVRQLPIFAKLTTDLNAQFSDSPLESLIIDFLAGTLSATTLYASIYEGSELSLPVLKALFQTLLANSAALESQAKMIYPQDAELVHRTRAALYYLRDRIEIEESRLEMASTMTTAEFAATSLDEFKNLLPFGWPLADGSTPDGRRLDLNLCPDENLYLSWEEFSSLFSSTMPLSENEIATKIKLFFGDWNHGYFRYFSYGGFANNSQELAVSYFDESVVLKRLLVLFANIIEFARTRTTVIAELNADEAMQQQTIVQALSDSAAFLKSQFESSTFNPGYFALMNDQGEYTGVVPKYTDRKTTPSVPDTATTLWRAKFQSHDLVDMSYAAYTVSAALAGRSDLNTHDEFGLFEGVLRAATPIHPTTYDEDYVTTLGPAEAQYLLGRLFMLANDHDNSDQLEKVGRLKSMLSTLSRSFVETMLMDIESALYFDYQDWHRGAGYPPALAEFLSTLSNAERLWVSGYLKLRLKLNDRFYRDTDSPQFEFARQDRIDTFIDGLDVFEANALLQKISALYDLNLPSDVDELSTYSEDPLLVCKINAAVEQSCEFSRREADRALADQMLVQLNENHAQESFSDTERFYMLCLVDKKLNGNANTKAAEILSVDATVDIGRIKSFLADFPQSEQHRLYVFLYNICYYRYTTRGDRFLLDSAGASRELFVTSDNTYWDFVDDALANSALPSEIGFSLEDFDDFEMQSIYFAWQNLNIQPALPHPEESYSAEYALLLNKILVDENFYGDNREFFDASLSGSTLTRENVSNADLLALVSPLLNPDNQQRQRLKERHDRVLASAVEWDTGDGRKKIDPYSEIVLGHVYRDAPELASIITAPYNEENFIQASLYSRFDAHAYSQNLPAPQELAVIFSRDYFATQMLIDDPRLLRQMDILLAGILDLIESEADGTKIKSWVEKSQMHAQAFEVIVAALDKFAAEQTLAYYRFHNFSKVETTQARLALLRCDLLLASAYTVASTANQKELSYDYAQ